MDPPLPTTTNSLEFQPLRLLVEGAGAPDYEHLSPLFCRLIEGGIKEIFMQSLQPPIQYKFHQFQYFSAIMLQGPKLQYYRVYLQYFASKISTRTQRLQPYGFYRNSPLNTEMGPIHMGSARFTPIHVGQRSNHALGPELKRLCLRA